MPILKWYVQTHNDKRNPLIPNVLDTVRQPSVVSDAIREHVDINCPKAEWSVGNTNGFIVVCNRFICK